MGDCEGDEGLRVTSGTEEPPRWLLGVCDLPKDEGVDESDKGSGLSTASLASSMNCNDHQSKSESQMYI